ncbi:MAG: methylthioribulose 1-phosphate dehydratase [Nitrospirae bacterium]|nr:methylthioribulose 1-phosphate dehydratase [Nitrospirota bacterium]
MTPESQLVRHAGKLYEKGWMAGTSGNLSVRTEDGIRITPSGKHKGELSVADLVAVSGQGQDPVHSSARPSAEISLHQTIYRNRTEARAVYHVHTVEANVVSQWAKSGNLEMPPLEMLKGFAWKGYDPRPFLPVFANDPDVGAIAGELETYFHCRRGFTLPGFLIRLHGLTVWGDSPDSAFKHIELFDFLFRFMVLSRPFSSGTCS